MESIDCISVLIYIRDNMVSISIFLVDDFVGRNTLIMGSNVKFGLSKFGYPFIYFIR
ncbi:hypothetical protein GIB67_010231 [Kingdonia uniflora]|uniref:Uncharacterized protein n=1 Tax=Kingdonia uniflora TaxID=39325 RepID=A0A7J7NAJ8_9MAGN|nr:hypothetical protein GIB67_010231 [Kingdonia uniflora]